MSIKDGMSCKKCYYMFQEFESIERYKCRRYPPAFYLDSRVWDNFPEVSADSWCGEFKLPTR